MDVLVGLVDVMRARARLLASVLLDCAAQGLAGGSTKYALNTACCAAYYYLDLVGQGLADVLAEALAVRQVARAAAEVVEGGVDVVLARGRYLA